MVAGAFEVLFKVLFYCCVAIHSSAFNSVHFRWFLYAFRSFIYLEESNILGKIQLYFSCVLASPILLLNTIIFDLPCCYHIRNMIMVCLGSLLCAIDLCFVCRPIPECFYYFGFIVYFII